jgi:hypothetical protein
VIVKAPGLLPMLYLTAELAGELGMPARTLYDTRPKLLKLLTDLSVSVIVVEHKDRLTRFGYNYLKQLLKMQDRRVRTSVHWSRCSASSRFSMDF